MSLVYGIEPSTVNYGWMCAAARKAKDCGYLYPSEYLEPLCPSVDRSHRFALGLHWPELGPGSRMAPGKDCQRRAFGLLPAASGCLERFQATQSANGDRHYSGWRQDATRGSHRRDADRRQCGRAYRPSEPSVDYGNVLPVARRGFVGAVGSTRRELLAANCDVYDLSRPAGRERQ